MGIECTFIVHQGRKENRNSRVAVKQERGRCTHELGFTDRVRVRG